VGARVVNKVKISLIFLSCVTGFFAEVKSASSTYSQDSSKAQATSIIGGFDPSCNSINLPAFNGYIVKRDKLGFSELVAASKVTSSDTKVKPVNIPGFSCNPQSDDYGCQESCNATCMHILKDTNTSPGCLTCAAKYSTYLVKQIVALSTTLDVSSCMKKFASDKVGVFLKFLTSQKFYQSASKIPFYNQVFAPCFAAQMAGNVNTGGAYQFYLANKNMYDQTYEKECKVPNPTNAVCPCLARYYQVEKNNGIIPTKLHNFVEQRLTKMVKEVHSKMYSHCVPALHDYLETVGGVPKDEPYTSSCPKSSVIKKNGKKYCQTNKIMKKFLDSCPVSFGPLVNHAFKYCEKDVMAVNSTLIDLQFRLMMLYSRWLGDDCIVQGVNLCYPKLAVVKLYGKEVAGLKNWPTFLTNLTSGANFAKKFVNKLKSLTTNCSGINVDKLVGHIIASTIVSLPLGLLVMQLETRFLTRIVLETGKMYKMGASDYANARYSQVRGYIKEKLPKGEGAAEEGGEGAGEGAGDAALEDSMAQAASDVTGVADSTTVDALGSVGVDTAVTDGVEGLAEGAAEDVMSDAMISASLGPVGLYVGAFLLADMVVSLVCQGIADGVTGKFSGAAQTDCSWLNPIGVGVSMLSQDILKGVSDVTMDVANEILKGTFKAVGMPPMAGMGLNTNMNIFSFAFNPKNIKTAFEAMGTEFKEIFDTRSMY
jgi:hypothetical protein